MYTNQIFEKVIYIAHIQAFCNFFCFLAFPFFLFLIFLLQLVAFYWAWFKLKKFLIKHHWNGKLLPQSSEICNHFCVYFMLNWSIHFDLGITGNIISPRKIECKWCQFCSKAMMSEEEQIKGQCLSRAVTGSTGINGLINFYNSFYNWNGHPA